MNRRIRLDGWLMWLLGRRANRLAVWRKAGLSWRPGCRHTALIAASHLLISEENEMRPIVIGLAALSVLASSPVCAAVVKNHPAVTPYAGSVATRRDDDGFKSYALVTAVNEKGKSDEEVLQTLKVSGNLIRFSYENPKDRSAHEIYTNYREGLEKGGFQILYACIEKECGPSHATSRWGRVTGLRFFSPEMRYIAAKGSK
ncbi:MAG: hypothetical protein F9K47_04215, partial [Burkholderiales bacterium]